MREILFRGKRKDDGEWVEGFLFYNPTATHIAWYKTNGLPEAVEVDPDTVCEWTGLFDEYGGKVFEGDIVDILTENEEIGVVTFEDGCFIVQADGFCVNFYDNINGKDVVVIGSIHDKAVKE